MWLHGGGLFLLMMCFSKPGEAAVRCYICSTKDNETACLYPESYDIPLVKCDQTALDKTREIAKRIDYSYDKIFEVDTHAMARYTDLDCLKVVTKLGNKKFTFRGCQLSEQSSMDICYKMKKADTDFLKKLYCSRCGSDRCNSAFAILYNRFCLFASFLASFFITTLN